MKDVQVLWPTKGETKMELLFSGFSLTQPHLLWPSGEGTRRWKLSLTLCLPLPCVILLNRKKGRRKLWDLMANEHGSFYIV